LIGPRPILKDGPEGGDVRRRARGAAAARGSVMEFIAKVDRFLSRHLTPVVKTIFVINCAVFILIQTALFFGAPGRRLVEFVLGLLAESPRRALGRAMIWQFLTYMFVHVGGFHILLNMLILWFFGPPLENRWGGRRFWSFYLITGAGAGLLHAAIALLSGRELGPIVGASGALFGVLLASAAYYPNQPVLFFGIFPIQIKWLVALLVLFEIFALRDSLRDGVSHVAHLSGALVAFLWLARHHHTADITRWRWTR